MKNQYRDSGPKPEPKTDKDNVLPIEWQIQRLESKIKESNKEIESLRRELGRVKSDLMQTINSIRNRG